MSSTERFVQLAGLTEGLTSKRTAEARATLNKFKLPFSQSGNWVNDARGHSVCEFTPEVAKAIAVALNHFMASE